MARQDDRFQQVVDLWYAAGFGERAWADALGATADLIGGAAAAILDIDRNEARIGDIYVHRLNDGVDEYVARMNGINPRMRHSLKQPGPHLFTDYSVLLESKLDRSEFYQWIERHHGVRYFVGSRIFDEGARSLCASVEFTRRHGHVDEATAETFERLTPHMANAWRVASHVRRAEQAEAFADTVLTRASCGAVVLGADGRVLLANRQAERTLARGDGLVVDRGCLRALRSASDRALQHALSQSLLSPGLDRPVAGKLISIARPAQRAPYGLRTVPCGMREIRGEFHQQPAVLVLIADPDPDAGPEEETLRALLGLSSAEARLACVLVEVGSLTAASRRLGIMHNTARSQLRNIFAKTQVRSQVELVRVLCALGRLNGDVSRG